MTIVTEPRTDRDRSAVVYGVVRFTPGGNRQVADVVITFASASAADAFAAEQGWPEYEVAPVRFFVHERQSAVAAAPPPARPSPSPAGVSADRRPWTGDPALPKQGHRPVAADPAGPPGSAATHPDDQAGPAGSGTQEGEKGFAPPATDGGSGRRPTGIPWGPDRWAVALRAESDPVEMFRAVGRLPADVVFTAAYGDVDVVLVYGQGPGSLPGPRPPTVVETALGAVAAGSMQTRWMTTGEREAFRAGYEAAIDGVRQALT